MKLNFYYNNWLKSKANRDANNYEYKNVDSSFKTQNSVPAIQNAVGGFWLITRITKLDDNNFLASVITLEEEKDIICTPRDNVFFIVEG